MTPLLDKRHPTSHWHHDDDPSSGGRLNWLRAAVLGANDGIVSTAGVVMGVAGATSDKTALLIAGIAALAAGALSMAAGEYVSVSTQRDSEKAMLRMEAAEIREMPEEEELELVEFFTERGASDGTARKVASELTAHDALRVHAELQLGIDPDELINPWHAAWASMAAFTAGALLPLLAMVLAPASWMVASVVGTVVIALAIAGWLSARLGLSPRLPAMARNIGGGALAMGITYAIGMLVGTQL